MQCLFLSNYSHQLEISGGVGPTDGIVFRFGLMGANASEERVSQLLSVLGEALESINQK